MSYDGSIISTDRWGIASNLVFKNKIIAVFDVRFINSDGDFVHECLDTSKWKEGIMEFNLKFTSPSGDVITSEAFSVFVNKAITV